ncbi:MAG: hypothetical protein WBA12_07890 [Catalinimonas sp.]
MSKVYVDPILIEEGVYKSEEEAVYAMTEGLVKFVYEQAKDPKQRRKLKKLGLIPATKVKTSKKPRKRA